MKENPKQKLILNIYVVYEEIETPALNSLIDISGFKRKFYAVLPIYI